ncbi:MAG: GNAT family N-acetyltransferase [Gemmatimonadaceae bacterium]|nr:GNAT family N-acetyltransferase [Gemmatimonadaceae bacterium]
MTTAPNAASTTPSWPTVAHGYSHVPAGHLASVVTFLEMRTRPPRRPTRVANDELSLQRLGGSDLSAYRALFAAVGERWLWFSRLALDDASLKAILDDVAVQAYAVHSEAAGVIGLLELDFRVAGSCELAFFGVLESYVGHGVGRWLMEQAMEIAWTTTGVSRVHVHTCTLDHPAALGFYVRSGFSATGRAVEVAPDPRALGLLPTTAAPDVPLTGPL